VTESDGDRPRETRDNDNAGDPTDASRSPLVMIVEDDRSLASWMADYLSECGFAISVAATGEAALELLARDDPDALILDLGLPGIDGLEVCRRARVDRHRPVLVLTARDGEEAEVRGLEAGADDYLIKPVRPRVLLARLRVLLRREHALARRETLLVGALKLDLAARAVHLDGRPLALSTREFDALRLLAEAAGRPVPRERLVAELRGIEYDGLDRSIDLVISRLRRRLGDSADVPRRIKTLRGVGYLLADDID